MRGAGSIFLNILRKGIWRAGTMFSVMLLYVLLALGGTAHAGTIRSVNAVSAAGGVTLKIAVEGGFEEASSFALGSPDRIVIDLKGAAAGVSSATGAGDVSKIRVGQFSGDVARLVIDLAQPMTIDDFSASENRSELLIRLKSADAGAFARLIKASRRNHALGGSAAASTPSKPEPRTDPPPAAAGKPVVTAPIVEAASPVPKASVTARGNRPLVVIDAGHGGHDTGALSIWGGKREKDVTLAIARSIKRELDSSGRVRAVLTRSDDRFLVLGERREVARRLKADLFISIHADSAANPDARGATVYTLSEVASDREAAKLASRENKSDIINGVDLGREASDVSSILIDLAQRDTMNVSSSFAALLQREMAPFVMFKNEFHRFAGFVVLKAPDTPSVLIETGYLSNMDDSKFLFSEAGQRAIAKGVKNAVEAHFARRYRTR